MKLLVVEDEKALNGILSKRLSNLDYKVVSCFNGEEALQTLSSESFDAVIMDIMMPKLSGIEVLREMKSQGISCPVLLLTAKDSVEDRVLGLDMGAHDYLVKPFSFDELAARIRAMLRVHSNTGKIEKHSNILVFEDLELNRKAHTVKRSGKLIDLSAKEFEVLDYLMVHQGEVMTRERIESDVWETDYCGLTNVIDVYIRYLRKKIDDDYDVKLIQTVRGVGYVLRVED